MIAEVECVVLVPLLGGVAVVLGSGDTMLGSASPVFLALLALLGICAVACGYGCEEYRVGEASNCTSGFPSLLHIDKVATNLLTRDQRQVVIPAINFSCNGNITRWIVGARWRGNDEAHTELQIWRRVSTDQYMKVNGTTINVASQNTSQVYELETSLAFQEGDILGYFQPESFISELNLYLEDSGRITTYHTILGSNDIPPPAIGAVFSTDGASEDTRYPLIAVRTDPPGCGCGFMSAERVYALLGISLQTGIRKDFDDQQVIFPSIRFTCSGQVVKWIMAGRWNSANSQFPELQIWRSSGDSTYERQTSTVISIDDKEDDEVYEFPVATPLPFQPGDILGVRQPDRGDSRLQVRYDNGGDSVYYATGADENNDVFDISGATTSTDIPLVTVEIVEYMTITCCGASSLATSSHTLQPQMSSTAERESSIRTTPTNNLSPSLTTTTSSYSEPHSPTRNPASFTSPIDSRSKKPYLLTTSVSAEAPISSKTVSESDQENNGGVSGGVAGVGVGVAVGVVMLIAAALILISLTVCLMRRRKKKRELLITAENMAYHSSSGQLTLTKEPSTEEYSYVSTHRPHPLHGGGGVATSANEAYGVRLGGEVAEGCGAGGNEEVELSGNVAYTATGGGGAGEGENYDYVTRSDVLITATPNEACGTNSDVSVSTNQAYGLVQS